MRPPTLSQNFYLIPISRDQRFLFLARPSFDLPLGTDRINDHVEVLRKHQPDRPAGRSVSTKVPAIVLGDAHQFTRRADVVAPVGAMQNVKIGTVHRAALILRDAPDGAPQDEDAERLRSINRTDELNHDPHPGGGARSPHTLSSSFETRLTAPQDEDGRRAHNFILILEEARSGH